MKVSFLTLGCKINQFYTSCIRQKHLDAGDDEVSLEENPDVAYVNTCSVTVRAGSKSRKLFRKAREFADEVKILGCHGKLFPEEFENTEFIPEDNFIENYPVPTQHRSRVYLPVQEGCNNFCSYCIVPYARGKNITRSPDDIVKDLKDLQKKGYREIILTGIHIGSYNYKNTGIKELLKRLLKFDIRIRLTSIQPSTVDSEFIKLFENKNLAPHLHVSQQSGSNLILSRMRRKYTRDRTLEIAEDIRKYRDVRLSGDFIVGFPGEGEEQFKETVDLIERAKFTHLHVFRYSGRPHTLASLYPERVPSRIKKRRAAYLRKIGERLRKEFIENRLGRQYRVIIEKSNLFENNLKTGTTPDYIRVFFGADSEPGNETTVRLTEYRDGRVYGKVEE